MSARSEAGTRFWLSTCVHVSETPPSVDSLAGDRVNALPTLSDEDPDGVTAFWTHAASHGLAAGPGARVRNAAAAGAHLFVDAIQVPGARRSDVARREGVDATSIRASSVGCSAIAVHRRVHRADIGSGAGAGRAARSGEARREK